MDSTIKVHLIPRSNLIDPPFHPFSLMASFEDFNLDEHLKVDGKSIPYYDLHLGYDSLMDIFLAGAKVQQMGLTSIVRVGYALFFIEDPKLVSAYMIRKHCKNRWPELLEDQWITLLLTSVNESFREMGKYLMSTTIEGD